MAITTRETTATGVTNKGAPLTNAEVDTNFVELQQEKIENVVEDTSPQLGGDLDFNGNKATSFTSTGIDDNATETAITIDADERVGINITPTNRTFEVNAIGGAQIISTFETTSTVAGRIGVSDANTTADSSVGIGSTGDNLDLYAGAAARATLSSSGDLSVTGDLTTTGFTSAGIDDNATGTRITVGNGFAEFDSANYYLKLNGSADTSFIGTSSNNGGYSYFLNNSPTASNNGFALYDSGAVEIWASADDVITGSLSIDTSGNTTVKGFTSTGIDDNATSTAITIDANENVGVGTDNPAEEMSVDGNIALQPGASNERMAAKYIGKRDTGTVDWMGSIGFEGAGNNGFATDITFNTKGGDNYNSATVKRMTISSAGKVGIGTDPSAPLHVKVTEGSTGETDPIARFERFTTGDNAYLDITVNNSTNMIGFQSTGSTDGGFTFGGATADLVTIDSTGRVGIGDLTPDSGLTVHNNAGAVIATSNIARQTYTAVGQLQVSTAGSGGILVHTNDSTNGFGHLTFGDGAVGGQVTYAHSVGQLYLSSEGAEGIRIDNEGNVGIGGVVPTQGALHIFDSNQDRDMTVFAAGQLHIDGNGYGFGVALNADGAQLYTNSSARDLIFGVNETEVARLTPTLASFKQSITSESTASFNTLNNPINLYNPEALYTIGVVTAGNVEYHSYNRHHFNHSNTNEVYTLVVDGGEALINGVRVGIGAGAIGTNTALGGASLNSNTTGRYNAAVGYQSLVFNTTGSSNTGVGLNSLLYNTTGGSNTAVGESALAVNTTSNGSTALGAKALSFNTTGGSNTSVGYQSLYANTTANYNTAIGVHALYSNTTASNNTAVGYRALLSSTTGIRNVALGSQSLQSNTTGKANVGIGQGLYNCTTGSGNIAIGSLNHNGVYAPVYDVTTDNRRLVMGHTSITNAYVKVSWTVTSDSRDKTEFAPVPHGLDFVTKLSPTEYQFKEGGREATEGDGIRRYGFLAQDILALEGDDPVIIDAEDEDNLKLKESDLIPVLVNAIKEQQVTIESLTARLDALESEGN